MENLIVKTNELFGDVRFVILDEKQYAVANDVAKSLGYKQPKDAVRTHCKGAMKALINTKGGIQKVKIISEEDILRLIQKSKSSSSEYKKKIKKWFIEENMIEDKFVLESRKEIEFFDRLINRINYYNSVYNEAFNMFYVGHTPKSYTDKINPVSNINLEFQKSVCDGKYRLDCFIENKSLVIEYDEKYHETSEQKEFDKEREININNWYKEYTNDCDSILTFVRVKEGLEDYYIELIMCYLTIEV